MKSKRLQLAMVLTSALGFCACWAVVAQEGGSLWSQPVVIPAEETTKPPMTGAGTKPPLRLPPPAKKKKADPTLIIPPEVYEVPQPTAGSRAGFVTDGGIVLTGGVTQPMKTTSDNSMPPPLPVLKVKQDDKVVPPPLPAPPQLDEKVISATPPPAPLPPPLPPLEPKTSIPPPLPEPTKALIVEPLSKEVPKIEPANSGMTTPISPPAISEPKKTVPNAPVELGFPPPVIAPPAAAPEPKKDAGFSPPKLEPKTPPTIIAPPVTVPEPTFTTPVSEPQAATTTPRIKSFVPVRSNPLPATPLLQPPPIPQEKSDPPLNPEPLPINKAMVPPIGPTSVAPVASNGRIVTPTIVVEKRGAPQLQAGETQAYQIVVRNVGSVVAQQVRIEDEIAPEVRATAAEPLPQVHGSKAVWTLPTLAPGAEQTLRISLQAIRAVQLAPGTSVHVSASNIASESTLVLRPQNPVNTIAVQLIAPTGLHVGMSTAFDIRVTNIGKQPVNGLTLRGLLGDGFNTKQGNEIVGKINVTLQPGETRTLKMPADVIKPGRHGVSVRVTPGSGVEVAASTSVEVDGGSGAVRIQTAPITKLQIGRTGEVRIDITNQSGRAMRNVDIACRLPDGVEFVAASERGLYQANSRTVFWHVENLSPEQPLTLTMRLHGDKAGQYTPAIFVRADGVPEVKNNGTVAVEGVADLTLRVIERDNPLEIGKDAVYEIQVVNPGTSPARDVKIRVEFPPGMQPKQAQGGANYSIEGQTVTFDAIPLLQSQAQQVLRVSATAKSPGDQRVRFAVFCDQIRTPVQREISTLVYRD